MPTAEEELMELSSRLLTAIDGGDWESYASLCDESLTCFEPEAAGHLVAGLPFHRYYFDLPPDGTARQSTISSPHVRLLGNVAVVTYVRLIQKVDAHGTPSTVCAAETRVWQKANGQWKHIHFHRS